MSTLQEQHNRITMELSDDDILAYLRNNPKFLKDHPEALEYMDSRLSAVKKA